MVKRRLILKCHFAPGDIVMLTAAVRDLHLCYPRKFLTDVRTSCPDLWTNNPHITPLSDCDPGVEHLDCTYPLINQSNHAPYHCLHGFIHFLNEKLGLRIQPTAFKGDIHLSLQEKTWNSQVRELTREATPFWVIAAGGKYDITIKWWQTERYQEVVDHFKGKILFAQVGELGHYHPKLHGVVDLRGQTNLRELIRLLHHSRGVLCGVTSLMHLAAAVPQRLPALGTRPCVVVAGGREPAHWEQYPGHQFIHTNGALPCCAKEGCWKDRTQPLRDGDPRDRRDNRCVDVVGNLPRCMALITPAEVIRRIELYFEGGSRRFLAARYAKGMELAIRATARNSYSSHSLNLHNAGMECEAFVRRVSPYPQQYEGRGIVICGGGPRYFPCAWVCISMLRYLGCRLPVQLWHLGAGEITNEMATMLSHLRVECVDAHGVRKRFPARRLQGWELKPFSILHSSFREILFLDADNVPTVDPSFLFETPEFKTTGAIFWPDYRFPSKKARPIWKSTGLSQPQEREFETGQIVLNKERCWRALSLTMWFNENSDFYYRYLHGDKETFHLAFRKLRKTYALVPKPIKSLEGTMCQHDFSGRRIFQHRNTLKWDLIHNPKVRGFLFEDVCLKSLAQLRRNWNGCCGPETSRRSRCIVMRRRGKRKLKIEPVILSCSERQSACQKTLDNFRNTDWEDPPVRIELAPQPSGKPDQSRTSCAYAALQSGLEGGADYILLLEDDLEFNVHLHHNLQHWWPLKTRGITAGSLYNPFVRELQFDHRNNARLVAPGDVIGGQAFLLAKSAVEHLVRTWHKNDGPLDKRIARLAARSSDPLLYHAPSLVQRRTGELKRAIQRHRAFDFDRTWRA